MQYFCERQHVLQEIVKVSQGTLSFAGECNTFAREQQFCKRAKMFCKRTCFLEECKMFARECKVSQANTITREPKYFAREHKCFTRELKSIFLGGTQYFCERMLQHIYIIYILYNCMHLWCNCYIFVSIHVHI